MLIYQLRGFEVTSSHSYKTPSDSLRLQRQRRPWAVDMLMSNLFSW